MSIFHGILGCILPVLCRNYTAKIYHLVLRYDAVCIACFLHKLHKCFHLLLQNMSPWVYVIDFHTGGGVIQIRFWSINPIYYYIHIVHWRCIMNGWNKFFLRDISIPRVGVAMAMCRMMRYCYSFLLGFNFKCIIHDSIYYNMDIGTMWYCMMVSCTPSQSIGLFFGCALFWCLMSLCVAFTNSLIACYSTIIVATIIGVLYLSLFILTDAFRLSEHR